MAHRARPRLKVDLHAPLASALRAPLTHEEIQRLIAEAAYYRAQRRGFAPGHEVEDWIEAETEVMTKLGLWE